MLDPAPTTALDPHLARAVVDDVVAATATRPGFVVLTIHNSDYHLHLAPAGAQGLAAFGARKGQRVIGRIRLSARRIDSCATGGRYLDPVIGPPRRVQGKVLSNTAGVLLVHAGVPVLCKPTAPGQKAEQFAIGEMVTFDAMPGASFELVE